MCSRGSPSFISVYASKLRVPVSNLHSRLECEKGVASIAHLENAAKSILSQVTYLQDFELRGCRAQIQLVDKYIVDNDWGFR